MAVFDGFIFGVSVFDTDAGFLVEVDSALVKVATALSLSLRNDIETDTVIRKLTAALNASKRDEITVASTLRRVSASINLSHTVPSLTIDLDLAKVIATITATLAPDVDVEPARPVFDYNAMGFIEPAPIKMRRSPPRITV